MLNFFVTSVYILCFFFCQQTTAATNIIYHQKGVNLTVSLEISDDRNNQFTSKEESGTTIEWNQSGNDLLILNLATTQPCESKTNNKTVALSEPRDGYHICKIQTTKKHGYFNLSSTNHLFKSDSFIESGETAASWIITVSNKRRNFQQNQAIPYNSNSTYSPFGDSAPSEPLLFQSTGLTDFGKHWPPYKPKHAFVLSDSPWIATLLPPQKKNDRIFVYLSSPEEQYHFSISTDEWVALQETGQANITGIIELIKRQILLSEERYDTVQLINQILLRRQQGTIFEDDDELLLQLLNNGVPQTISITESNSPGIIYLGKKKKESPSGTSQNHESTPKKDTSQSEKVKKETSSHDDAKGAGSSQPPPPPTAKEKTKAISEDSDLDVEAILRDGYTVDVLSRPEFPVILYGLGILNLQTAQKLSRLASQASTDFGMFQQWGAIIAFAGTIKATKDKLTLLKAVRTSMLALPYHSTGHFDALIPDQYKAEVTTLIHFDQLLPDNLPPTHILKRLLACTLFIQGSHEKFIARLNIPNLELTVPSVLRYFKDAMTEPFQRIGWEYLHDIFSDRSTNSASEYISLSDDLKVYISQHTERNKASRYPELLPATLYPLFDIFIPIQRDFLSLQMLSGEFVNDLGNKTNLSTDEFLFVSTLVLLQLKKQDKIINATFSILMRHISMRFEVSRGILPATIVTRQEVCDALNIQTTFDEGQLKLVPPDLSERFLLASQLLYNIDIYQVYNLDSVLPIITILDFIGKEAIEIGAGHGMLSAAIRAAGHMVLQVTDTSPSIYSFFSEPIARLSATDVIQGNQGEVIFIASSPSLGMINEIASLSQRAIVFYLGKSPRDEHSLAANILDTELILSGFNTMYFGMKNGLLFINYSETEKDEVLRRIPRSMIAEPIKPKGAQEKINNIL